MKVTYFFVKGLTYERVTDGPLKSQFITYIQKEENESYFTLKRIKDFLKEEEEIEIDQIDAYKISFDGRNFVALSEEEEESPQEEENSQSEEVEEEEQNEEKNGDENGEEDDFLGYPYNYPFKEKIILQLHLKERKSETIIKIINLNKEIEKLENEIEAKNDKDKKEKLDLLYLFSSPIIDNNNIHKKKVGEGKVYFQRIIQELEMQIDYRGEIDKIINELKNLNKNIKVRFEPLTKSNYAEKLKYKTKVLHISCHGGFEDKNIENENDLNNLNNKFHLSIENNGYREFFTLADIEKKLVEIGIISNNKNSYKPKVTFISACHSEPLAKLLSDNGFKNVICINKYTPILDSAAKEFSAIFYRNLFSSMTIAYSFYEGINTVRKNSKNYFLSCKEHCHFMQNCLKKKNNSPKCGCPRDEGKH